MGITCCSVCFFRELVYPSVCGWVGVRVWCICKAPSGFCWLRFVNAGVSPSGTCLTLRVVVRCYNAQQYALTFWWWDYLYVFYYLYGFAAMLDMFVPDIDLYQFSFQVSRTGRRQCAGGARACERAALQRNKNVLSGGLAHVAVWRWLHHFIYLSSVYL
jgi:hypothetical protein